MLNYMQIRQKQAYLPTWLRDPGNIHGFDTQKDFFYSMWLLACLENKKNEEKGNWISLHVFSIDLFLYGLARFGYVLKHSKKPLNFSSYNTIRENVRAHQSVLLGNMFAKDEEKKTSSYELPKVSQDVLDWIKSGGHLLGEFKNIETKNLGLVYLFKSIDCSNNESTNKLSLEDKCFYANIFMDNAAKLGYVLKKQSKEGDFDNLLEKIEPYREDYRQLKNKQLVP